MPGLADLLGCLSLAGALAAAALKMRAREGLPNPDEGYLWYGTLRVLAGEAPLRDFRSYEPGRYRWCALTARLWGDGLIALRISVHTFFAAGLACGLVALRLGGVTWPAVFGAALLLAVWAYPGHKLFEPALLLAAILAGTELVRAPGLGSEFILGATVGAIGFFGINLALYTGVGAVALTLIVALAAPGGSAADVAALVAGVLAGALPLAGWFLAAPGTASVFWQRRVLTILRRGTTNLHLPVPWPWKFRTRPDPSLSTAGNLVVGLLFGLLPLLGAGVWIWAALASWPQVHEHPALVAAAAVGLPALHHAFSRADLSHLAPVVSPFIVLLAALFAHGLLAVAPLAVLVPAAWVTVIPVHPRRRRLDTPHAYETVALGSSRVRILSAEARGLEALRALIDQRLQPQEPLALVPTLPALLPLLGRRSGVYDTFCVYPASRAEQLRMLRDMEKENIRLVVVQDLALDGREDLRFARTHPLVWRTLQTGFAPLAPPGLAGDLQVFWRGHPTPGHTPTSARPGLETSLSGSGSLAAPLP